MKSHVFVLLKDPEHSKLKPQQYLSNILLELVCRVKAGGGRIEDYRKCESLRGRKGCSCEQRWRKVKRGRICKWRREVQIRRASAGSRQSKSSASGRQLCTDMGKGMETTGFVSILFLGEMAWKVKKTLVTVEFLTVTVARLIKRNVGRVLLLISGKKRRWGIFMLLQTGV